MVAVLESMEQSTGQGGRKAWNHSVKISYTGENAIRKALMMIDNEYLNDYNKWQ